MIRKIPVAVKCNFLNFKFLLRIVYNVVFISVPPMLSIPNQLEGAYVGQDVTLECRTEAFPTSINYWTTERGDMIISGSKYL